MKTTGDGLLVELSSVVDALRCATEWQRDMAKPNADVPPISRIEFRIGVHQGRYRRVESLEEIPTLPSCCNRYVHMNAS